MALHQAERTSAEDVIRHLEISSATFYRWKNKYEGLLLLEVKRLKMLVEENPKLKHLVGDLSLDLKML